MPTTYNSGDETSADAVEILDRLPEVFAQLGSLSHEVRCQVSELLDTQSGSCPYKPEALVRLLERLDYDATVLNRAVGGYAEAAPEDEYVPELAAELKSHGWEEQHPRTDDGFCEIPPGGTLTDRVRGFRRTFTRASHKVIVFYTGPQYIAYAYAGTRWLNAEQLHELIASPPQCLAAEIGKALREKKAQDAIPFPLTLDQVVEHAEAAGWYVRRDQQCTERGVVGYILDVPDDGEQRPGRSVTLANRSNSVEVHAWGLPAEPAHVRIWTGPVRTLDQLDDLLGRTPRGRKSARQEKRGIMNNPRPPRPRPCGCVCCSGGFCGGCGHAGCGRR